MGMKSKRARQLLDARKKEIEIKRNQREAKEANESWQQRQDSTPGAMMMVSTKILQKIVNQFCCPDCNRTGE